MKTLICRLALLCFAVAAFPAVAQAQFIIRFIASYGNDANPCTRPAPCRSMQRGVDATPAGSELQVIDSAGYGPNVVITRSITISAEGVQATVATVSGIGIRIDAPNGFVVLRNIRLRGPGPVVDSSTNSTQAGIRVNNALYVRIENCVVDGFGSAGISYASQSPSQLHVINTISSHNGAGGLHIFPPSAGVSPTTVPKSIGVAVSSVAANVSVVGSKFLGNEGNGIYLEGGSAGNIQASITDSVMSGNFLDGLKVSSEGLAPDTLKAAVGPPAPFTSASCDRCTSADNGQAGFLATHFADLNLTHVVARGNKGHGIEAKQDATVGVSDSQSTVNSLCGMRAGNGGNIQSLGNNLVRHNFSDSHCGDVVQASEFSPAP